MENDGMKKGTLKPLSKNLQQPKENAKILVIGDIHAPYEHPDAAKFIDAVRKKEKPTRVILSGDELDNHSISYHEHDPDGDSPNKELEKAIEHLQPFYDMFPKADILESNHGSLVYRKGKTAGLPSKVFKSYNEILDAPKGWKWHYELIVPTVNTNIYFHHGKSSSVGKLSKNVGMSSIQGHFHTKFYIYYWASPYGLFFDANAGCLVDRKSLAHAYMRNNVEKQMLGCMVLHNGIPQLIPMLLNSKGKWIGKI
jgi:hypothetical protein